MPAALHAGPLDARQCAWCPTMDLLAVLTDAGNVVVYRAIGWHRLTELSAADLGARALCAAWRPDGRVVALGLEDGSLALMALEGGVTAVQPQAADASPVRALHWAEQVPDGAPAPKYADRAADLLPQPLPASASRSTASTEAARDAVTFAAPAAVNVLAAGRESGAVHLYVYGRFHCGHVETQAAAGPVRRVALSGDLRLLSAATADGGLETFDTAALWRARRELGALATHGLNVALQLAAFAEALARAEREWKDAVKILGMKFGLLDGTLRDYESHNAAREELRSAVTCGMTSAAMAQFLTYLGAQSVQRLHGALRSGCGNVERLFGRQLLEAAQGVLFRAAEVRGMSGCRQFAPLGLSPALLSRAVAAADGLLRKVCEGAVVARAAQHDLLNLLHWVVATNAREEPQQQRRAQLAFPQLDLRRLADFLERPVPEAAAAGGAGQEIVASAYLGEYWKPQPLSEAAVASASGLAAVGDAAKARAEAEGGSEGGEEQGEDDDEDDDDGQVRRRSVKQQLDRAAERWAAVVAAPRDALSGLLRPAGRVAAGGVADALFRRELPAADGAPALLHALRSPDGSAVLLLAALTRGRRRGQWLAAALDFADEPAATVALYGEVVGAPWPNQPALVVATGKGLRVVDVDAPAFVAVAPAAAAAADVFAAAGAPQPPEVIAELALEWGTPLAVAACGPRGLACVVSDPPTVHIVDVEGEEESEGESDSD